MEAKKIFSKFNLKNYNNELEEILENKVFSFDVKNLLLSMLYKIENAYKDYATIKQETLSLNEIVENIINIIKEKCYDIEFILPDSKEKIEIDKEKGKIRCYPNERSLLSCIWYMGEIQAPINTTYFYTKEALQKMIEIGSNMNIVEILRDFNGWSWDISTNEIESIKYNILYQSLLLLDEKKLVTANIDYMSKDSIILKKDKKDMTKFITTLTSSAMQLYKKESKELEEKINNIKIEKEEKLKLIQDKKAFVKRITEDKKQYLVQIEQIDKIINNTDLLKKEYKKRNELLPNKEKIFSISHLSDILEKERETILKQIQNCNKMIEPKTFIKEKENLEKEVEFLQNEKTIEDCCKEWVEYVKNKIIHIEDKSELKKWIYKIRYFYQLPFNKEKALKDVSKLKKDFKDLIILIIKTAQQQKVWDIFTENIELSYMIIQGLFCSKMIELEDINIICEYKDGVLIVSYYEGNTLETKLEFKLENIKIKRKIKLFI